MAQRAPFAVVLVLLLSACGSFSQGFTPEQVALGEVAKSGQRMNGLLADMNTAKVMQNISLGEEHYVQVAFQGANQNGRQRCLFLYEIRSSTMGGLTAGGGGGSCSSLGAAGDAVEVGMGQNSGSGGSDPGFSYVDGFVNDPQIKSIRVTWSDGEAQQVEVVDSTYLALRLGDELGLERVEGLGAEDEVLYTNQPPRAAPGKGQ